MVNIRFLYPDVAGGIELTIDPDEEFGRYRFTAFLPRVISSTSLELNWIASLKQ